ncbi:MAG: TRL-like family protein [Geminicoccaceae bacterium]
MTDRTCLPAFSAKGILRLGTLATAALMLTGCAYWPSAPHNGAFYTNVTSPVAVLDQEAPAVRTGEACSTGILGLFASGNSSVNAAKSKVGITKISTVEERYTHYLLGAYSKYCTIVSGT